MTIDFAFKRRLFPFLLVFYEIGSYLSNDLYLPSMPRIAHDLGASIQQTQYTLSLWVLGSGLFQLFLGPLGDRIGRRPVLLFGAALFTASTLGCAWAPGVEWMWLARFLQGASICALITAGYATLHQLYQGKEAVQLLALMGAVIILAPALGPVLGALLLKFMSWRTLFLTLAAWGLLSWAGLYALMPETRNPSAASMGPKALLSSYGRILAHPPFLRFALSFALLFGGIYVWNVEAPFILVSHYGYSELGFGGIQALVFGPFVLGARFTHRRVGSQTIASLLKQGFLWVALGALLLLILSRLSASLWPVVVSMMLLTAGGAIVEGPLSRLAMEASPQPLGQTVAVFSTLFGLSNGLAGLVISVCNDKTFATLSIVMAVFMALGLLSYASSRTPPQLRPVS